MLQQEFVPVVFNTVNKSLPGEFRHPDANGPSGRIDSNAVLTDVGLWPVRGNV